MAEIKREVIEQFQFEGTYTEGIPYGSGHINDTFRVTFQEEGKTKRYILQRMNTQIFLHPGRAYGECGGCYFLAEKEN